jgi:putative proton-coupled thiamine transporter YuaJ
MDFTLLENLKGLLTQNSLITIFTLALLIFVLYFISKKTTYNTKILTYGALSIALSFVLSYVKLFTMPNGGTITPGSMLPLFAFASIAGPGPGIAAGLCYGLLQSAQDFFAVSPIQYILDYPLAFAMLGLAGFFRKNIYVGSVVGATGRFICHLISGIVFFAEYAGNQNVFVYSFLYNISYILPDLAISLVILAIPAVRKAVTKPKLQN